MLLVLGLLAVAPVSAYDSDYDDEEQEVKKSKKKKTSSEDDYWDEDSWEDDEVEPIAKKKKKKKSGKKKKSRRKNKIEEETDSWDDEEPDGEVAEGEEEDFYGDDAPAPAPPESSLSKTAMGGVLKKQERPKNSPKPIDARTECVKQLRSNPAAVEHVELNLVYPGGRSVARVNKQQRVLLTLQPYKGVATVLELTERELRVKWDDRTEERFLRQPDNTYMKDSLVKLKGFELSRKARRTASRLLSRAAVAEEDYGWTGKLIDFITGNEPPLTYETFRLVNEKMDTKVRFSESEMVLVKMSGQREAAAVLGYTGVKLHVRWENGEVESYKRLEDGSYRMIDDERVARQLLDPEKCVRERAEDDWFIIWWRDVMNEEKPLSYVNVKMQKEKQEFTPRISKDNLVLMQTPPHQGWAKVIQYDRKRLIIRWDGVREELYERGDDGVYYFVM